MYVEDVLLLHQVSDEVLPFFAGQVGGQNGYLGCVPVALPVDANRIEACIAQCRCKPGVSTAYFYCPDLLSVEFDWDF